MLSKMWFRAVLLGILIALLGIPPGALTTLAQQDGPQTAPPSQQQGPMTSPAPQNSSNQQGQAPPPAPGQPPQAAIAVESNLVNMDVTVTDQNGDVLTNLKKDNFRILDDGQVEQITNFSPSEAPITIVILMEFSNIAYGWFGYKAKEWAYGFLSHLNDKDWVAFKTFDLKTNLMVDFTRNKQEVGQAIASLYFPGFTEANLFDAVIKTVDQMRDVHGKKAILVLATGLDTFSKHTLDQTYKLLKETDVTIFCVGMGEEIDLYGRGSNISYLQAKNELTQFGEMTGGYAWFPRFEGEMPDIFNSVAALLRSQYTIGFTPGSGPDGKFHKLKVEMLDNQGNPLLLPDKKGKMKKVIVYARQGYMSPKPTPGM